MQAIFIGGCDRSGTTMLGAMLGADPATVCLPESHFIAELAPAADKLARAEAERLLQAARRHPRYLAWAAVGCRGEIDLQADQVSYSELIEGLVREYAACTGKPDAGRWIDHSPMNVSMFARLKRHFADAKLLHIVRDGRAVAHSLIPLDWGPNDVRSAAKFWMMKVGAGLAAQAAMPDSVLTLRYEDLVRDPAGEMRRVAAFVGVPFSPALTRPTGFRLPAYSREIHAAVGRGVVDPARIDDWRRKLSPRQIEVFEYTCKDFLPYMGYAPVAGANPRGQSAFELLGDVVRSGVRHYLVNAMRYTLRHRRLRRAASAAG